MRLPRYPVLLVLLTLLGAVALVGCGGEPAVPLATPTQAAAATEPTSTPEPEPTNTTDTTEESNEWMTYTPDDSTFKIEFPGEPDEQTMPAETAIGQITVQTVSYMADGPEYNLSYNNLPAQMAGMDAETAASVLENSLDDLAQGGEFRNQKVIEVNGYLGIRGEIDMDINYAWYMTVITPKRQYQIIMITSDPGRDTFAADAERFLNSFAIMSD